MKIEKLEIIGCQSSQGEIREKINEIIDRLNEEEPKECEGYHPSKPDKLQRLLKWVENEGVVEYDDFVLLNPIRVLRDLATRIKELIDEK